MNSLVFPEPCLEHEIRLRAYELYLQRGRREGHALDDWLQAETEVFRELDGATIDIVDSWNCDEC